MRETARSGIRRSPACPRSTRRRWIRVGTRIDDDCSSSSARTDGSSAEAISSSKSSPAHFASSQPRKRPRRIVLAADDQGGFRHGRDLSKNDAGRGQSIRVSRAAKPGRSSRAPPMLLHRNRNAAEHNHLALQRNPHYLSIPVLIDGPIAVSLATMQAIAFGAESARCCTSSTRAYADTLAPFRKAWRRLLARRSARPWPGIPADPDSQRGVAAACELFAEGRLQHHRPEFGIDSVLIGNRTVAVREEKIWVSPFATLLHFAKETPSPQPRVLLVRRCLGISRHCCAIRCARCCPEHDVYVTDWHNARDVPLVGRRFRFRRFHRSHHLVPRGARARARMSSRCASRRSRCWPRWR